MITRRHFVASALALPFASALGAGRVFAQAGMALGDARIDIVSDGFLTLPRDMILGGLPEAELSPILAQAQVADGALTPPCNLTLLRDGDRVVLFDVGSGPEFQGSAGIVLDSLDALGIAPEDVTDLVLTHGHPDHLWGLLDDFGDLLLPEARLYMGRAEFDYWWDDNTVSTIDAARQAFAVGAKRRLESVADQITLIDDGQEPLPGVMARATHGHTPGHMAFEIRRGSQSVMVVGDALGNHHVAFARPDWITGADQDGAQAAQTRQSLLDQITAEQMIVAGFHLPGGLGRVEQAEGAYRFAPLA